MASSLVRMLCICVSIFLGPVFFVAVVVPAAVLIAGAFVSLWAFSLVLDVLVLTVVAVWQRACSNKSRDELSRWDSHKSPTKQRQLVTPAAATGVLEPSSQTRGPGTLTVLIPSNSMGESTDGDDDSAAPGSAPALSQASTAPADSPQLHPHARELPSPSAASPGSPACLFGAADCAAASCPSVQQQQPVGDSAAGCEAAESQPVPCGGVTEVQPNAAMDGSWLATCVEQCRLGQGSFGHVDLVLVTRPGGGQFRAARKRMVINDDNLEAFEAEIQGLREGLGCPYIVQLYDYRTTDTHFELLLELLEVGSVEQELASSMAERGRALSPERIRQIAVDSLRALDHLHRRGLCARDVKPDNLLVRCPSGAVVLADLGLATRSDSGGRLQSQLWAGTPEYLVPEARTARHWNGKDPQLPGYQTDSKAVKPMKRPALTVKVDVFALGRSLYRCAGWRGELRGWQAAVPAGLQAFLDHLMEVNPTKRPTARRAQQHPFLMAD